MKKIIIKTKNEEIYKTFNEELLKPLKEDLKNNPNRGYVKEDDNKIVIMIKKIPKE